MMLESFAFHLRARNLSPRTIKATLEYLRPFLAIYEPLSATRHDVETYLGDMTLRCRPATVMTAWRHLGSFFMWLHQEGDITDNPMRQVPRPLVPPTEIPVLTGDQTRALLKACAGHDRSSRRDYALIALMLDTGLRLSEATGLRLGDVSEHYVLRVFGKGRKWRTVQLGQTSSLALRRWLRIRPSDTDALWTGRMGPLTASGIRRIIRLRGLQADLDLHPHMLRHAFVDNWLRQGGTELDLAHLCGWTSTRMAARYASMQAHERALNAHQTLKPLDQLLRGR